jgi:hypothetical protein
MADTIDLTAGPSVPPKKPARVRRAGAVLLALVANLALLDAAVETWQSGSALRIWVTGPVALYLVLWVWLARQQRRNRPDAATSAWLSVYLLLALAAFTSTRVGGLDDGIRLATLPTSTVLSAATIAVLTLAIASLGFRSPLPLPLRLLVLGLGLYALFSFGVGLASGRTYVQMIQHGSGGSPWSDLPYWVQGQFVGALVLVPFAFVMDVGVSLARVKVRGRMHRIVAFALGFMMAQAALGAPAVSVSASGLVGLFASALSCMP